jgi:small GTP-binding protein
MGNGFSCTDDDTKPRILMLGLKGAGKTTILHHLKDDEQIKVFSVQEFNTQSIEWEDNEVIVWDLGVSERQRNLWRHYFVGSVFVIFVIDGTDKDKLPLAKSELNKIAQVPELTKSSFCFLINKNDEQNVITNEECSSALDIGNLKHENKIFSCSAKNGIGVDDAMKWVKDTIDEKYT